MDEGRMNGQRTDGQMDRQKDRETGGTDGQTDGWMDGWTHGLSYGGKSDSDFWKWLFRVTSTRLRSQIGLVQQETS